MNKNDFFCQYQMVLICEDGINNDSLSTFKTTLIKMLHDYDAKSELENINFHGSMKCAYPVKGKSFVNVITLNLKLTHSNTIQTVIENIRRKLSNGQVIRNLFLKKDKFVNLSDIGQLRKSVESAVYI